LIPESTIDPLDMESLADVEVDDEAASAALRTTAVIKLNAPASLGRPFHPDG